MPLQLTKKKNCRPTLRNGRNIAALLIVTVARLRIVMLDDTVLSLKNLRRNVSRKLQSSVWKRHVGAHQMCKHLELTLAI